MILRLAVLMVTVSVATPFAEGAIVVGEKAHAAPMGRPEHEKETAEVKPLAELTEIENLVEFPAVTVAEAGLDATEKSGGGGACPVPESVML
jgi:hypothetical protein